MQKHLLSLAAIVAPLIWSVPAQPAALRVEPIFLELNAPAAAASLSLRNDEDGEIVVQTRVMRWSQTDGQERLEPTTDVVASPPQVRLAPHSDYLVRVVRTSRAPVSGEESYRVIVDQLPRVGPQQSRAVNLLIRQSIPVFFRARDTSATQVSWHVQNEGGRLTVSASNAGDERMRVANLRLRDASGQTVTFGNGLTGYVLGRSTMSWVAPKNPPGFGSSGSVTVTAETDKGQTHAIAESLVRR